MKKISIRFAALLLVFAGACAADPACEDEKGSCAAPLNPNGDSELALLMREMHDSTAVLRQRILDGQSPGTFPPQFQKLLTAKATNPEKVNNPAFPGFAQAWLSDMKKVYESAPEDIQGNYMLLVQSCRNCHEAFCPGPLVRINKLGI